MLISEFIDVLPFRLSRAKWQECPDAIVTLTSEVDPKSWTGGGEILS